MSVNISIYKSTGSISSSENLPIRYDLYTPGRSSRDQLPVLIFLHGFKGFKDWGPFPAACEDLARQGFAVIAMNFSLNGVGDNSLEFDRPDLFERQTLSQDLDDVGSVIQGLKSGEIASSRIGLNTDTIGIIGHSRGGHTAVAAAAEYPEIQCLVTWAAVADYSVRWSDQMLKDWEERGYTEILNARTGQKMKLSHVVRRDVQENGDRLIALRRVKEIHLPSLFIAGKADEAVPWRDSDRLYRSSPSEHKELRLIPETGHTFDAAHPFEADDYPEAFREVLSLTEGWFISHLYPLA